MLVKKIFGLRTSALIEIALFFALTTLIAFFSNQKFNYQNFALHPFWIIIILIPAQYGTGEGLLAALIASLLYFLGPLPEPKALEDKFAYTFQLVKVPLLWFVTALILGEIRLRHMRERDQLKQAAKEAEEREKKITDSYNALKRLKESLETRLVSEMQTALTAYSAFKRLESSANQDEIMQGALHLAKTLILPEKCSVFQLQDGALRCVAKEGWTEQDIYRSTFDKTTPLFTAIVEEERIVSLSNPIDNALLGNEGMLAAPIVNPDKNQVFGMIKIEKIPFSKLRMTTIETLHSIGEWVGMSLKR